MNRRWTAWLLVGVLAVGLLGVWGGWTTHLKRRGDRLALELEAERQRNFHELVGHMQSLQGLLAKGTAAGSVRQNQYYMSEVFRRSSLATSNFMALPLPGPLSASVGKFLNQTGDFAFSLARNEAAGRAMDATQRAELGRLQQVASQLANQLQTVGSQATQNGYRWVGDGPTVAGMVKGWRQPVNQARVGQNQTAKNMLPGGIEQIGPQLDRMPSMIYDGPFSDHMKNRKAAVGGAPITEDEAKRRALAFIPGGERYTVVEVARREGTPKTFAVRLAPTGTGGAKASAYTASVDVAQEGGHLVSLVNARPAGAATLNLQRARDIGREYLEKHGFANMVPTYGEAVNGFATVQFALRQGGIMIYPDQVKVRVALDTGEVVGIDAKQYMMSHRERGALEVPAVTQAAAAKVINPELKVQRVQMALIPTETGDNEVLTYEFMGQIGQNTFLVYVNAKSGEEERILQLLTTPHGTMAL